MSCDAANFTKLPLLRSLMSNLYAAFTPLEIYRTSTSVLTVAVLTQSRITQLMPFLSLRASSLIHSSVMKDSRVRFNSGYTLVPSSRGCMFLTSITGRMLHRALFTTQCATSALWRHFRFAWQPVECSLCAFHSIDFECESITVVTRCLWGGYRYTRTFYTFIQLCAAVINIYKTLHDSTWFIMMHFT